MKAVHKPGLQSKTCFQNTDGAGRQNRVTCDDIGGAEPLTEIHRAQDLTHTRNLKMLISQKAKVE